MLYDHLFFQSYKSFLKKETTHEFSNIKKVNVLIGKNSAGKSSLLDLIQYSIDSNKHTANSAQFSGLQIAYDIYSSRADYFLPFKMDGAERKRLLTILKKPMVANMVLSYLNIGEKTEWSLEWVYNKLDDEMRKIVNFANSRQQDKIDFTSKLTKELNNYDFFRLAADRDIVPESYSERSAVGINGKGATSLLYKFYIIEKYNKDNFLNTVFLPALNTIFAEDGVFTQIQVQENEQGRGIYEVYLVPEKGEHIALSRSGSGLKTIFLVLVNLLLLQRAREIDNPGIQRLCVFGFEELENNLHPALQRRLFEYLYEYAAEEGRDVYIFLTTHSHIAINCFFGKEQASIAHIVKNQNEGSRIISVNNYKSQSDALNELGVKASDLLQTNGIIWVEGPSDRIYIKHWLSILYPDLKENTHYQFIYYGGALLSYIDTHPEFSLDFLTQEQVDNLIHILKINRNAVVIMDSDKKSKDEQLSQTKERIIEELNKAGMVWWVTAGKDIENYLDLETIKKVYPANSPQQQCGPFEDFSQYMAENGHGSFDKEKTKFAKKIIEKLKDENEMNQLDLKNKLNNVADAIKSWNGIKEGD